MTDGDAAAVGVHTLAREGTELRSHAGSLAQKRLVFERLDVEEALNRIEALYR